MSDQKLRFLSSRDIRQALPMVEAISAMKQVFAEVSQGAVVMPPRQHVDIPEHEGTVLFMPSHLPGSQCVGMKVITLFGRNPSMGLPRIQAMVLLFDGTNGCPLAVFDGASLTAIRTGAASGAATDLLARREASSVAVLGTGVQAGTQLEAVCTVRPIRQVTVFDASLDRANAFAAGARERHGISVDVAGSAAEAIADADIVCVATTSRTPVFADKDLGRGVHINAIGSYQPAVQELPAETVIRARVVVDHRESALAETGDLIIPIQQGRFSADRIYAEIGEIAAGLKPGRQSEEEITLFKSVGLAAQDAAAAACALRNADRLGLGTVVQL